MRVRFPPGAYCGKEGPSDSWEDTLSLVIRRNPALAGRIPYDPKLNYCDIVVRRDPALAGRIPYDLCIKGEIYGKTR